MEQRNMPRPGTIYKHFKNKLYQIITIALDSETGEEMVVYQALYGKFLTYVRPLDEFMGKVEGQKYRFELISQDQIQEGNSIAKDVPMQGMNNTKEDARKQEMGNQTDQEGSKELVQFLDATTCQEKLNILMGFRNRLDDTILNNMLVSLDIAVSDGSLEERFEELKDYLQTRMRFEFNRRR